MKKRGIVIISVVMNKSRLGCHDVTPGVGSFRGIRIVQI
jgi:hypothetical protein